MPHGTTKVSALKKVGGFYAGRNYVISLDYSCRAENIFLVLKTVLHQISEKCS